MKILPRTFQKLSLCMIAYTLIVILWGAYVKISHSGDGCGKSWPLCHDNWVPAGRHMSTWIEFSHRVSSGLYGILVLLMIVLAFKTYPTHHPLRKAMVFTGFFTLSEALLGAVLVLAGLVGSNDSVFRAYVMALHLVNSLLLVASFVLVYDWALYKVHESRAKFSPLAPKIVIMICLFLIIASSGGIASLSTTLFPSESLFSGLVEDFSKDSHFLVRIRISHPLAATLLGGLLIYMSFYLGAKTSNPVLQKRLQALTYLLIFGVALGYVTLFALSPIFLKFAHLIWAYGIWIVLILCLSGKPEGARREGARP